jgi:hypothetical protein
MTTEKNNFIQIGNEKIPCESTISVGSTGNTSTWITIPATGFSWEWDFSVPQKNPYVPKEIHVNEKLKIVIVKWDDGTETKVTCDDDDTFNVDAGFAQALKYKTFGGKSEFKEKWAKIIYRRVHYHESKILDSELEATKIRAKKSEESKWTKV